MVQLCLSIRIGGKMKRKRHWGKSRVYYCEKTKTVWQWNRKRKVYKLPDMPTYGLIRKEIPNESY
tara:strand:+ start:13 stop:207 length:195 start_codon:yes stop_codon:yes gene_type:complete